MLSFKLTLKRQPPFLVDSIDGMRYDEMEIDEESEPEVPVYDRAELIERYQVKTVFRSKADGLRVRPMSTSNGRNFKISKGF